MENAIVTGGHSGWGKIIILSQEVFNAQWSPHSIGEALVESEPEWMGGSALGAGLLLACMQ